MNSQSDAQQFPAWSPQPYVRPATDSTPRNSLRSDSGSDSSNEVVRWRKTEGSQPNQSTSYSQTLTSETVSKQQPANVSVIRQPSSTVTRRSDMSNGTSQLEPASGWAPKNTSAKTPGAEPATAKLDKNVQLASFEAPTITERANSRSSQPSESGPWKKRSDAIDSPSRLRLNPSEASSRRSASHGVQRASYQEDSPASGLQLPQAPSTLPQRPGAGIDALPPSQLPSQDLGMGPSSRALFDKRQEEVPATPMLDSPSDKSKTRTRDDGDLEITPAPRKRPIVRSTIDCDTIRQSIESSDITQIRVDSSPTFVEGYKSEKRTNSKDSFLQNAPVRPWYNADGQPFAEGRLVDIVYGSVVLETIGGSRMTYLLNKLSDADQVYVSESWGIPVTCSMGDGSFDPRNFTATTMTWKASGACHKPLYFEEVQLERYGHEWGPWAQPAISSLNFVKNVAFLPYKMGIHPMNECQYSLGYYRPGSCAPWTVGPIPISLRGAAAQAAAVSGAALALP